MKSYKNGESETTTPKDSSASSSSSSLNLTWYFALILILSLGTTSAALSLEGGGEEDGEGNTKTEVGLSNVGVGGGSRVKRSRDVQQLCGYRLLDALRSVCDRNFVGMARRSDPLFLQNGEFQSGEDSISIFTSGDSNLPWEILAMEFPKTGLSPSPSLSLQSPYLLGEIPNNNGGGITTSSSSASSLAGNGEGGANLLDYLELMQQQQQNAPNGGRNAGSVSNSNKAFALKMLSEPPKTHQRFRRNIIDECCKKPCAIGQMLKYCAITNVGKRGF